MYRLARILYVQLEWEREKMNCRQKMDRENCEQKKDLKTFDGQTSLLKHFNRQLSSSSSSSSSYILTEREMIEWVNGIFHRAKTQVPTMICALVLVMRYVGCGFPLTLQNWKSLCLTATILAEKMVDDDPLCMSDYAIVDPELTKEQIRTLENAFIQLLNFDLLIPHNIYATYYFELRSLIELDTLFPSHTTPK
jgi:hypothetical protein